MLDGDPLRGDPLSPEVRHVLRIIRTQSVPRPHEPCPTDDCQGCTASACVHRRTLDAGRLAGL